MTKIGKISALKKEFNSPIQTMQSELMKRGLTRVPGTAVYKYPFKELDGRYRTGLDPDAPYIRRIQDETARGIEKERVSKLRKKLEDILQLDLGPHSDFWNYALAKSPDDRRHVQPVKLQDGDNFFDLSNPWEELNFAWLRVHPTIASSYQAWERGEYPAETQFYVVDDDIEQEIAYKKKQLINKAIVTFDKMTPEKRKKVARLLGLPISDDAKETVVYNLVDSTLKQTEFKSGNFRGLNPVEVFNRFATMDERILTIRDLVKQAINHSVYRVRRNGRIFEGDLEIALSEDDLVKYLSDDDNQEELVMLEQKLKMKKVAAL